MSTTPALPEVLRIATDHLLQDVHTAIPGRIESYDPTQRRANVQPLVKRKFGDEYDRMPMVVNVPVIFPGGGGATFTFPLAKGDKVLLIYSERSLDEWLSSGREVEPADPRHHCEADGVCIPGLFDFSSAPSADSAAVVLATASKDVKLDAGGTGKFAIGNASAELLDIFDQLIVCLQQAKVMTQLGPQKFMAPTQTFLANIKTLLSLIKGSL